MSNHTVTLRSVTLGPAVAKHATSGVSAQPPDAQLPNPSPTRLYLFTLTASLTVTLALLLMRFLGV